MAKKVARPRGMQTLQSVGPHPLLRPFVRLYAERVVRWRETLQATCMPRVETILKFELGVPLQVMSPSGQALTSPSNVVVGAFGSAAVRELLRPGLVSFAIFFRPSGFTRLFGVPMALNTNAAYESEDVAGRELRLLHERVAEAASFAERVQHVEAMLMRRASTALAPMPTMDAADHILKVGGLVRIERVARTFGCTVRTSNASF